MNTDLSLTVLPCLKGESPTNNCSHINIRKIQMRRTYLLGCNVLAQPLLLFPTAGWLQGGLTFSYWLINVAWNSSCRAITCRVHINRFGTDFCLDSTSVDNSSSILRNCLNDLQTKEPLISLVIIITGEVCNCWARGLNKINNTYPFQLPKNIFFF